MSQTSTNGAGAAIEVAAAGHEDQRGGAELGLGAGGRAAPKGVPAPERVPDPELVEQAKRRTFTAEYKARILAEAGACTRPGEIGELLRREGLYTSHLAVHYGQAQQLHAARARVLGAAFERNPERFVRKLPVPPELPTAAWINKPAEPKEVAH
jgi:hypothetical protein